MSTPAIIEHRYRPVGTAMQVFKCRDDELLVSGPAGTGKSRALLEKMHAVCLATPKVRALIVRKVAASLGSTALVTWREHVATEALRARDVVFYGGSAQEAAQYRYRNGSTITLGGMDKATKVMSSEYDIIYVQEAIELTETDWEALTTRLRNGRISFQQLMADANPDKPTHWLKARVDAGRTTMIESRHEDNPVLFDDDGEPTESGRSYITKLDNLTGVRKQRLRYGKWVAAEGLIYEGYSPHVHHKPIIGPPVSWERFWVVDFGFTNPMVLQHWAEDPDGRLYMYREFYQTKTLVEDMAKHVLKVVTKADGVTWKEPKPTAIICDHDAEDRATLERHLGLTTIAAHKSVSDGIQAVQARLRVQEDGKPRLFLSPIASVRRDPALEDAKKPCSSIEEMPGYVWDTSGNKSIRESPLKIDDHGVDCIRYVVAHRDLKGRSQVRFM